MASGTAETEEPEKPEQPEQPEQPQHGRGRASSVPELAQRHLGAKRTSQVERLLKLLQVCLIDSKAVKGFLVNFLLAYNVRAGVAMLLRAVRLLTSKPGDMRSLDKFLGESNLSFRTEAVRIGLFFGGFAGMYRAVLAALKHAWSAKGEHERWHSAVAGGLAGSSLYCMDKSWHRTLALYMATRAVQSAYNLAKLRGHWHFWGSDWEHGDSLLFALSSAQVMYAYVMRPESLPPSYYRFIVRQGPLPEVVLQAVRDNVRGRAINLPEVMDFVKTSGGDAAVAEVGKYLHTDMPTIVPCRAMHPYTAWCSLHSLYAFTGTSKRIFPVYLSLALVPAVVLRFSLFAKEPLQVLGRSLLGAARSTAFLAVFCGGYQAVICAVREVLQHGGMRDHKLWYYFAGIISSLSILIERKSRRSELALYAFPRAADSLYHILYDHQLAFRVPQGEVLLFCAAMSSVMWFYDNETQCLSPLVAKLLDRFIPHTKAEKKAIQGKEDEIKAESKAERKAERKAKALELGSGGSADGDSDSAGTEDSSDSSAPNLPSSRSQVSLSGGFALVP